MNLSLSNVINVSVSATQSGIGEYNTSNLSIFSREAYNSGTFGTDGYKIYLEPTEVGVDFGTSSNTYKMALAAFSQQPNILANNGYLVVLPFADTSAVIAVQHIAFSAVPATGNWKLNYGNSGTHLTSSLAHDADAAAIQTALRLLTGLSSVSVSGDYTAGFNVTFTGVSGPATLLTVQADSLQDATPVNITPVVTTTTAGTVVSTETLAVAIARTKDLIQYFGIMAAEITSEADMLAAAAVVEALNKMAFFVSRSSASIDSGGLLDLLTTGDFHKSRGLYYGAASDSDALVMMASYAGRGLSTNFDGSNTTQTMHLKDLIGVQADPSMTQTLLNKAQDAGADVYASFEGVAKVFCSGANHFFDQVYNLGWFVGGIEVAGFNYLAQTSTKIPQTDSGMNGLKGAYRKVCQQGVTNQYLAPGEWNSPTTFGNQGDFLANISQVGYFIYSPPIAQQSQSDREDRNAPLVQIAVKEAGSVHKSTVIIYVNA